jgi:dinuclear metal center YbgI/SA1388 family protein
VPALQLATLTSYLDDYLQVAETPDEANAVNGLQVENRSGQVRRIVAAVDASLETIQSITPDGGPPLLLVHHGLFWDGNLPLTGRRYRRVQALLERDIALYSAHIPLDVHPEVGNNAVLGRRLGLRSVESFDSYRGIPIGVRGILDPAEARESFLARVEKVLGAKARLIPGGAAMTHRVGILTGAAGSRVVAAHTAGLDTYVTGEGAHHTYFDAMELGVNLIYAGHYATETAGVRALAEHLGERFALPWEFHDHPTGM